MGFHQKADEKAMANTPKEGKKMSENPETPQTFADVLDDMIEATKNMGMVEYRNFMELPVKERIEAMNAILEKENSDNSL